MMAGRRGGWMAGPRPGRRSTLAALIWLAFIVFPLVNAVTNKGSALDKISRSRRRRCSSPATCGWC